MHATETWKRPQGEGEESQFGKKQANKKLCSHCDLVAEQQDWQLKRVLLMILLVHGPNIQIHTVAFLHITTTFPYGLSIWCVFKCTLCAKAYSFWNHGVSAYGGGKGG